MPALQKFVASAVHVLLYVLMIAMPLTGWIMASAQIGQHETRFFGTFEMYVPGIATNPTGIAYSPGPLPFRPIVVTVPVTKSPIWTSFSLTSTITTRPLRSSRTEVIWENGSDRVRSGVVKATGVWKASAASRIWFMAERWRLRAIL